MPKGYLRIRSDLSMQPDDNATSVMGLGLREGFDVLLVAGRYMVLRAVDERADVISDPTLVYAGDLAAVSAPDVISQVHAMGRDGVLTMVLADHSTKSLFFKRGDVVFARSSLKDDRLGECLVRQGRIDRRELQTASMLIGSGVKLGKALVDANMISPHELWEGLKYQVEEILMSVFQHSEGSFAFVDGELNLRTEVRLNLPTAHYILEGVSRFDELREHYGRVSNLQMVFVPTDKKQRASEKDANLTGLELDVFTQVDGSLTVDEIVRSSNWSEHYTLLALARLLRAKWIVEGEERPADDKEVTPSEDEVEEDAVRGKIERANVVLGKIYKALERQEGGNALHILNSFFDELKPAMRPLFKTMRLGSNGHLDVNALLINLGSSGQPNPSKYLMRGLSDLIGFALFTAGDMLPTQETELLVEAVASWSD